MIESIIFDTLPTRAVIDGRIYEINYGYRAIMAVEIEMFSAHNDEQKILNALRLFYLGNIPGNLDEAIKYMLWFHRCGKQEEKKSGTSHAKAKRGYCFEQDAPLIYAAFMQQYHINLRTTRSNELHWWEFAALFESLDENILMAKVMYWRTCNLNGMSPKQRKFINKMRSLYEIKEAESTMDSKAKLAKRNMEIKAYVKKRMEECQKE